MRQELKSHPNCLPEKVEGVSYPKESWLLLAEGGDNTSLGRGQLLFIIKDSRNLGGKTPLIILRTNDFFYFLEAQTSK